MSSRRGYLSQLEKQKKVAERLNEEAAKLDAFLRNAYPNGDSHLAGGQNGHAGQAGQADTTGLVQQLRTLRAKISSHLNEVNAVYRRCFADNECTQRIGAKIGLIGLEKAGKSTFLSGWATKGATSQLLPSTTVACTGTTVQLYSSTRSAKFSATVEYFTEQDFAMRLLGVCSVVDNIVPALGLTGPQCPNVRAGVAGLRQSPPLEITANLNTLASELRALLQEPTWAQAKQQQEYQASQSGVGQRSLDHMLMLDKLLAGYRTHGHSLGEKPTVIAPSADALQLGTKLWPFISMVNETDMRAAVFETNLQPLVVKLVSILGPLPGLPDEIEINDLPGLDSNHEELNQRTTEAYKEMDILVFVKNCMGNHPQLWPSEITLLQQVQGSVDPTLSRVLALMNCFNSDLEKQVGLPEVSLVAAQDVNQRFLHDKSRILFGFADVLPNRNPFHPERVQEVLADAQNNGFTIDSTDLNGYERFTVQLQDMVRTMPERDIIQTKKLRASFTQLQQEIARVDQLVRSAGLGSGTRNTKESEGLRALYDNELLPTIQANVAALKHNTHSELKASLLPNFGTLFYFRPELFEKRMSYGFQVAAAAPEYKSSELHRNFDDEKSFSTYEDCFVPTATFDPARANQKEICDKLIDAIKLDAGVVGESTRQALEDAKYLNQIRAQLASDQVTQSIGTVIPWLAKVRDRFNIWMIKNKGNEPLTFASMEGHYRRLVREEFDKMIQWIQKIDRANKLSTLDHLVDIVLLTQTHSYEGCLLNLFVQRPPKDGTGDTAVEWSGAGELKSYLSQVKVRIYNGVSSRLQEVATDTLRLLLGIQQERKVDNPGMQVSVFDKQTPESLKLAMAKLQRASYVTLIQAPCGHTLHTQHDVCQHAGWLPFDWNNYLSQLNGNRVELVNNRRELVSELPIKINQVRENINTLEEALASQAALIFKQTGADSAMSLMKAAPGYAKDYLPMDTTKLKGAQKVDSLKLPAATALSAEALQAELQKHEASRQSLVSMWELAKSMWSESSKRFNAVLNWLSDQISNAKIFKNFTAEQQALQKLHGDIPKAKSSIDSCDAWVKKLDVVAQQLQDRIALDMQHPSLTRKAFLESLFCLPLQFTEHDVLSSSNKPQTVLGEPGGVRDSIVNLLMRKQKRSFVERDDFVIYSKDTGNPQHLMENFPPEKGPEWDVLMDTIHTRTMKALEHITELICHVIQAESSLAMSRERICDAFWNELSSPEDKLWPIVDVYRAGIWPQLFASSGRMDHVATCVHNINKIATEPASR